MTNSKLSRQQFLEDLRRLDRAIKARGNRMVVITEHIEDTIPDTELPD
jgi:hypothetical protein